ncbi:MAG TPA: hypothetical protein PLC07_04990 [Bacillota bacterium]|nr:hypothetical protein [Bacillota bacterium]HPT86882.1 hypothetical protein [Bacillota bacterium]
MPDIVYSTGPIEQESGVNELRLKALNNSTATAEVFVTVYDLNGTKEVFYSDNFTLDPFASAVLFVDIPNLDQFEVEFTVTNPEVLVAVFAVNADTNTFSAANSVRHGEMVNLSAGV